MPSGNRLGDGGGNRWGAGAGNAPAGITWDQETDVLVCGAGNGGMSAALAAAEAVPKPCA